MPQLAANSSPLPKLQHVAQSLLDVQPVDWSFPGALPRRFLNPGELEVLIALVRSVAPARVVEIGVNEGRTAAAILKNVPDLKAYLGIDVLPGYVPKCTVQRREIPTKPGRLVSSDPRFSLILRKRGSFDLTPRELGAADVVFLDGDHSREAVTRDTILASEIVRPGGILIWHDYHNLGTVEVRPVLDELAAAGREIRHVENTWLAFQRF